MIRDDVARQIPVFRPQPVAHPRPDARPPESLKAGMQKQLSRGVIELFRSNRFHNSQFVRNRPHQRQVLGQLQPTLPMRVILESSPQQRRMLTDERQLLALEHVVGALLPVPLDQFRFVVEQLQVRRATDEVNIDNVLRPRGTMWFTREKRVYTGSREQVPIHRRGQGQAHQCRHRCVSKTRGASRSGNNSALESSVSLSRSPRPGSTKCSPR